MGTLRDGLITGGTFVLSFDVTGCCGAGSEWQNTGLASNTTIQSSVVIVLTLNGTEYRMFGHSTATKQ